MNENSITKDQNNINNINNIITNEKLNLQTCCICLEEQTQFDIENDNKLIEYNHCGSYFVHNKCLDKWKSNECLICRKKINENFNNQDNNSDSDNDLVTILVDNNDSNLQCKKFFINLFMIINILGIGTYFFYQYIY